MGLASDLRTRLAPGGRCSCGHVAAALHLQVWVRNPGHPGELLLGSFLGEHLIYVLKNVLHAKGCTLLQTKCLSQCSVSPLLTIEMLSER